MDAAEPRAVGAEDRRAAMRDAGLQIWADEGWAAVTAPAVCAATGVSPSAFAAEFATAEELLGEIFDEGTEERTAVVLAAMEAAGTNLVARIHACLDAVAGCFERDPRQAVVLIEAIGSPVLRTRRRVANRGFATLIAGELRPVALPISPEQLHVAAHFCLGGLAELVLSWQDEGTAVDRARLVEHGTLLFEACLTAR
ncbi:TetR family transcriptional regulator [Pseudonocardia xishanensis]|uniref:HTH tetR-type domain-containing protein n=1 Tax=Pseudonocardia xishanensis TaxID=630995 RepID=A0ABP8S4Z4_9PSEU